VLNALKRLLWSYRTAQIIARGGLGTMGKVGFQRIAGVRPIREFERRPAVAIDVFTSLPIAAQHSPSHRKSLKTTWRKNCLSDIADLMRPVVAVRG
jgi:hypothetical protein